MPRMRDKARRFTAGPGFAYVVVLAFLMVGVYLQGHNDRQHLRASQIAQCERGNEARAESNARIGAHREQNEVMRIFLRGAIDARLAAYRRDHHPSDLHAAREYQRAIRILNAIRFGRAPEIACAYAVDHPHARAPVRR